MEEEIEKEYLKVKNNVCNVVRMEVECGEGVGIWLWNVLILWFL